MAGELSLREQQWIEDTLERLSLREKIAQTAQDHVGRLDLRDYSFESIGEYLQARPVGNIFIAGEVISGAEGEAEECTDIVLKFQKASKLPLLVAGDLEHGAGAVVRSLTRFPDQMALGAADDESLAYEFGKSIALEGATVGFNWTFSPVVDLALNWLNPIVSTRSLGTQPERVATLAAEIVRGLQEHRMAGCVKHFPGDGVDFKDQHICTSLNALPEQEWWETFGKVFQRLVDAGVYSVMVGHIALPWLDGYDRDKQRYRPASISPGVTTELLRRKMNFQGLIVSDALDMGGYVGWDRYDKRIVDCFNSGVDVLLWPGPEYIELMERAIQDGRVSMQRLETSVKKILELKARLGLPEIPGGGKSRLPATVGGQRAGEQSSQAADALSLKIASQSITLVRNRKGLLPFDGEKIRRILVTPFTGTGTGRHLSLDPLLRLLEGRGIQLTVRRSFELPAIRKLELEGQRWNAHLVPFYLPTHGLLNTLRPVGESARGIWAIQQVETVAPVVISLSTPFLLMDMPFLDTLVNVYSASPASLEMLVKALFGEIAFQGRSPVKMEEEEAVWQPEA